MRNRDAARYARWSAGVAMATCLVVIGVFVQRRVRGRVGEKNLPPVPEAVKQQSAGFEISRAIGSRTLFIVHASTATQFKDENRSLLENVEIEIYGPRGDRNDSVHANECSYETDTGSIRCQGVVQIDLRAARTSAQKSSAAKTPAQETAGQNDGVQRAELHLETSNILFEHDSGKVSTENPVTLRFFGGTGSGIGMVYEPQTENVTLEKNVQLEIVSPQEAHPVPVHIISSKLEFRRGESILRLTGPVRAQQGAGTLTAGALELQLNSTMQPSRAIASESPEISSSSARGKASLAAEEVTADLSPRGEIEKLDADGNVRGESSGAKGANQLSAQHAQVVMDLDGEKNEAREVLVQGQVNWETEQGQSRGNLATESLRIALSPNDKNNGGARIASAETLAAGKLGMSKPGENVEIQGGKLSALFGAENKIEELRGASGVRVARTLTSKPAETSTAENLLAKFGADGNWRTIDEGGNVKVRQGDEGGTANTAQLVSATNQMTLAGAATVEDPESHLQADKIQMNQTTGEMQASGNVVASFAGRSKNSIATPAGENTKISADEMRGTSSGKAANENGHAVFTGHARLWEGSDVLQAQTIEFWQGEKRAEARGDVLGEFIEAPHKASGSSDAKKKSAPVLWRVHAPQVDYWSDLEKMEWSDGVEAQSSEGTIRSQNVEMFFSRAENNQQTLERAIGTGSVRIEQNGRTGTAERGEYFSRDGKFVLSGGTPTIADASGNTTAGRQLTFFLANDSILVDSQSESRNSNDRTNHQH